MRHGDRPTSPQGLRPRTLSGDLTGSKTVGQWPRMACRVVASLIAAPDRPLLGDHRNHGRGQEPDVKNALYEALDQAAHRQLGQADMKSPRSTTGPDPCAAIAGRDRCPREREPSRSAPRRPRDRRRRRGGCGGGSSPCRSSALPCRRGRSRLQPSQHRQKPNQHRGDKRQRRWLHAQEGRHRGRIRLVGRQSSIPNCTTPSAGKFTETDRVSGGGSRRRLVRSLARDSDRGAVCWSARRRFAGPD